MSSIKVTMKSKKQIKLSLTRLDSSLFLQKAAYDPDGDGAFDAGIIAVDTENFTGNLSSADDTLQKALETLDQLIGMEGGTTEWGNIQGTLSSQTDLQNSLNGKASTSHNHTGVYEPANSNIQSHISSTSNPHNVTIGQIGAASSSHDHSGTYEPANSNIQSHVGSTSNPHNVTASQVGLGNVANISWGSINAQTDSYTLQSSDNGKVITVNKGTAVTVTIPDSLTAGFSCSVIQLGAGQVSFAGSGSMAIRHRLSHSKIAGQYGGASLYIYAQNNVSLVGDTAA